MIVITVDQTKWWLDGSDGSDGPMDWMSGWMAKRLSFWKEDGGMMTELKDMDGLGEETTSRTSICYVAILMNNKII